LGVAVGCGGSGGKSDDGATGGTGGAMGGSTGTAGMGGTGGIGPDGLPYCQVATRPADPLNTPSTPANLDGAVDARPDATVDAAVTAVTSNDGDNCNRLDQRFLPDAGVEDDLPGPTCAPESFTAANDGGVLLDGGAQEFPAGGSLVDGDYDLIRYRSSVAGGDSTKRTIAVYDAATYIEWAVDDIGGPSALGHQVLRLNTTMNVAGTAWRVVTVNCGSLATDGYGYTASGTELDLFNLDSSGVVQNVYTYRRTCSR
jgi:hypothetical protein